MPGNVASRPGILLGDRAHRLCASTSDPRPSPSLQQGGEVERHMLGVHALVFSGRWDRTGARRAISGAKKAGYDLIEIPLLDPSSVDPSMTTSMLQDYGMRATASLGLRHDADISSEDWSVASRGERLLLSALDVASAFGSTKLCGVLYSALAKYPGPLSTDSRRQVVSSLKRVAAAAAQDYGMSLCLEVVNRYETNVVNTCSQAVELLSDVGAENIKIHLDTYHMNIEESSMKEAIQIAGDSLAYVHIGESHRGYLGTGTVNFEEMFQALRKINYSGPIVFESFSSHVVSPELSNTLCVWRNLWSDSDDLAFHAKQFMEGMINAS